MRLRWAGFILCLLMTLRAGAAVTGRVDSIGFDAVVRPDCWVPLVIQTTSDETAPVEYDLHVVQYDLDGDEVLYSRDRITINPGTQNFWTYFKPEPVNGGIPATGSATATDLSKRLRIFLVDPNTGRRMVQVSTTGKLPQALEFGDNANNLAQKLILVIGRRPNLREFDPSSKRVIGRGEQTFFVRTEARKLPDNVIGYQSVDAVVWTDADPSTLDASQWRALRAYVSAGGRLAIVQNAELQRFTRFADMLPVVTQDVTEVSTPYTLRAIIMPAQVPRDISVTPVDDKGIPYDPFRSAAGPYRITRATALADAYVSDWMTWPDKTRTPYIARRLFGCGVVSWLAQDVTDPGLTSIDSGWPRLWDKVFDFNNDGQVLTNTILTDRARERFTQRFQSGGMRDMGASYIDGTNLESKTTALVSLVFAFFVVYWIVAGPGAYLVLAAKKRTPLSWFIFAATAVLATGFTVVVARFVLGGAAQVRHVSLIRMRTDDPQSAHVKARMGVYIPRNVRASIAFTTSEAESRDNNSSSDGVITTGVITPLVLDPRYTPTEVNPRDSRYTVPVPADGATLEAAEVNVPFRSTLKKIQIAYTGPIAPGGISGQPVVTDGNPQITGVLSNSLSVDLNSVVIAFRSALGTDQVLFVPTWKHGQSLDLGDVWKKTNTRTNDAGALGLAGEPNRGPLEFAASWLFADLRQGVIGNESKYNDAPRGYPRSFPIVSLFSRLPAMQNSDDIPGRVDIHRRGVRDWDISAPLGAGAMIVLAQSTGPLPAPVTVEGSTPQSDGINLWQFVIPVTRPEPTTQPDQ